MKKAVMAGIAAAVFCGAPAIAAPPAAPMFNWTGFYVGGAAGYGWGRTDVDYSQTPVTFSVTQASQRLSPNGFAGGGQVGYNYQLGRLVYGIEADLAWRDAKESFAVVGGFSDTLTVRTEQKWLGTVRGRLGVTPTPNSLLYATGGLAYGRFEHFVSEFCNVFCGVLREFSSSKTKTGWTAGIGYEIALTPNVSLGIEYLYMDFGTDKLTQAAAGVFGNTTASFNDRTQVLWAKLNYRFGGNPWGKSY